MNSQDPRDIFDQLFEVLCDRKTNPSEKSYTSKLFAGGVERICSKISEEASELVDAAFQSAQDDDSVAGQNEEQTQHLVHETADLFFHVMVLLAHKGLSLQDIRNELGRRFGISGLEEKANREKK